MQTLDQIKQERIKKRDTLISQGRNPYPAFNKKIITISEAREKMEEKVDVAGRIVSLRGHGKLVFADLKDETAKIQLMFKADLLDEQKLNDLKLVDMGDFLHATGKVGKSMAGETSILVDDFQIITKSIRPMPEKWHGLKDVEERYRQRYVDLLVNAGIKDIFLTRTKIITLLRKFFNEQGFVEVETPVLQPLYGGASAKPFITHHNALDIDLYLRISDELYLKKLVVGGFEKVYEIGRDFRNEGLSRAHNPEFTMLEFYWAYVDYQRLMTFTEKLFEYVVREIKGNTKVTYKEKTYDFTPPWKRIKYRDLILDNLKININEINTEEKLKKVVIEKKLLPGEKLIGFAQILDKLYKKHIRPNLEGPLFLIDHPFEMRPLAKKKEDAPSFAASFQLLVAGEEFINAYNELNDPADQRKRWEEEMKNAARGAEDYQVLDEDYIRALEYGMPPTAGWGLGVDRLVAFLTDQHNLKDVILFPTLRPESLFSTSNQPKKYTTSHPEFISGSHKITKQAIALSDSECVRHDIITREKALEILNKNLTNKNLIKHNLAVEAAMRALASHFKEDENKWGLVGLVHDADWEATKDTPKEHTRKTLEWLKEAGVKNNDVLNAILSHNYVHTGQNPPNNNLEWSLYCCDDLTGLIIACALVMPDKKIAGVTTKSVLKKFPSKNFAAGANREQIKMCEEKLGIKLEDFVDLVLKAMQGVAPDLGL